MTIFLKLGSYLPMKETYVQSLFRLRARPDWLGIQAIPHGSKLKQQMKSPIVSRKRRFVALSSFELIVRRLCNAKQLTEIPCKKGSS